MTALLLHHLRSPELSRRLAQLASGAPPQAPVSLRLELGIRDTDLLAALPARGPFWYCAEPARNLFRLGIGHAFHIASAGPNRFAALDNAFAGLCHHWCGDGEALAFSGFAFDASNNHPLPNALLAIPGILLECIDNRYTATLTIPAGRFRQAPQEWQDILKTWSADQANALLPDRPEPLLEQAWVARVRAALRDIRSGHVDKLVLSRKRTLVAEQPFSATNILANLLDQQADSLIYAHGNGRQIFLGASPEQLVKLQTGCVSADALAGTAWPGSEALQGDKNQHEQLLVVHAVVEALRPLCTTVPEISPTAEHPAGQLRHLRSRITANVYPDTRLFELVRALHPTPAVGGFPIGAALEWLADHREQRSAWYSGGFGMLDRQGNGEFCVALRSALLDGRSAELQAGAGIVAGSDPQQEFAETEAKLATLRTAIETPPRQQNKARAHA